MRDKECEITCTTTFCFDKLAKSVHFVPWSCSALEAVLEGGRGRMKGLKEEEARPLARLESQTAQRSLPAPHHRTRELSKVKNKSDPFKVKADCTSCFASLLETELRF